MLPFLVHSSILATSAKLSNTQLDTTGTELFTGEADVPLPAVVGLNGSALVRVRALAKAGTLPLAMQSAFAALRAKATAALAMHGNGHSSTTCSERGPWSVTGKVDHVAASGDLHDFTYLSTYAWPCNAECNTSKFTLAHCKDWWRIPPDWSKCDNKTGLPWRGHDGFGQSEGQHDTHCSVLMSDTASTLAIAYFLTSNETFAEGAAKVLRTWFIAEKTKMNPNMMYAAATPGLRNGSSDGIIATSCRWTTKVADAASLLASSTHWSSSDAAAMALWNAAYLTWLTTNGGGFTNKEWETTNNHFTWLSVESASLALSAGNESVAYDIIENALHCGGVRKTRGCLQAQIASSGLMYWEARREAGASYSTMNTHALFQLATVSWNMRGGGRSTTSRSTTAATTTINTSAAAARVVPSLWTWVDPGGSGNGSLRNALDYLLTYATNATAVWPWHQDGTSTSWSDFPWCALAQQMRVASLVYGDMKYEAMIPLLPWKNNDTRVWEEDTTQLVWPYPPLD